MIASWFVCASLLLLHWPVLLCPQGWFDLVSTGLVWPFVSTGLVWPVSTGLVWPSVSTGLVWPSVSTGLVCASLFLLHWPVLLCPQGVWSVQQQAADPAVHCSEGDADHPPACPHSSLSGPTGSGQSLFFYTVKWPCFLCGLQPVLYSCFVLFAAKAINRTSKNATAKESAACVNNQWCLLLF